jgi:hemoglobin
MTAFWSSVMLGTERYHGSLLLMHLRHAGQMMLEMFTRWLEPRALNLARL